MGNEVCCCQVWVKFTDDRFCFCEPKCCLLDLVYFEIGSFFIGGRCAFRGNCIALSVSEKIIPQHGGAKVLVFVLKVSYTTGCIVEFKLPRSN